MIILDEPLDRGWRLGANAHLISTLPGEAGAAELLTFAQRLGLRPAWLQNAKTETEHFDLTRSRADEAVRLGARVVDKRELVVAIRAKRRAV